MLGRGYWFEFFGVLDWDCFGVGFRGWYFRSRCEYGYIGFMFFVYFIF